MLDIFSEEQGSCEYLTVATVCHLKKKIEIRLPKAEMIVDKV